MNPIVAGALSAALAGCAAAPFVPPPLPDAAVPTLAIRPLTAPSFTGDYTHRTPVEPDEPPTPQAPGFSRPRIGS